MSFGRLLGTLWRSKVVRFGALGVANNLLAYGLFAVMTIAGVPAIAAASITYALGMIVSYVGNRSFTFAHAGSARRSVVRFLVVNAVGYGINVAILAIFVEHLEFDPLLVQLAAIVLVAGFIFVSMRFWVFADDEPRVKKPLRWGT
ncbi:GtrA family protein [Agreia sp. PsM10]|uniref:GtrA family protein n=1 Tax=Agreia sp. PsM10 TaxID=3030533 RepID=UPI00263B39E4|nr:GtrA family protein [Agreia sp. PsM10]MDN4641424.1 GtrA family protein [Agreia sp. PsM10]